MLRLLPPPAIGAAHGLVLDYLPDDGAWQDMQGLRRSAQERSMLRTAMRDLRRDYGMIEVATGRRLQRGGRRILARLTAEGRAFKAASHLAPPAWLLSSLHGGTVHRAAAARLPEIRSGRSA